jgi:serine/threonine protein kinase
MEVTDVEEYEGSVHLRGRIGRIAVALDVHEFMDSERLRRINTLSRLPNHSNVVQVYGIWKCEPRVVISWCDHSLRNYYTKYNNEQQLIISIAFKKRLCCELVTGLMFLHNNGIVHGALKPDNIFICGELATLKLGGFWETKSCEFASNTPGRTVMDSLIWNAPELLCGKSYSFASDMYSCGMILYFIISGQQPFLGSSAQEFVVRLEKKLPDWTGCTGFESWIPLIERCWSSDTENRLTAKAFLENIQ